MAMKREWSKHLPYLQLLSETHRSQRQALVQTASTEQIRILSEIVLNLLEGNIPITPTQKKNLHTLESKLLTLIEKKGVSKHFDNCG